MFGVRSGAQAPGPTAVLSHPAPGAETPKLGGGWGQVLPGARPRRGAVDPPFPFWRYRFRRSFPGRFPALRFLTAFAAVWRVSQRYLLLLFFSCLLCFFLFSHHQPPFKSKKTKHRPPPIATGESIARASPTA